MDLDKIKKHFNSSENPSFMHLNTFYLYEPIKGKFHNKISNNSNLVEVKIMFRPEEKEINLIRRFSNFNKDQWSYTVYVGDTSLGIVTTEESFIKYLNNNNYFIQESIM